MSKIQMPKYLFPLSLFGTILGSGFLIKDSIGGPKYRNKQKMNGKTVIITGANSGIGKATAQDMASRGAKVIMACRDLEKCKTARAQIVVDSNNTNISCYKCDLASLGSIRAFAKTIRASVDRVDVLINNAGVMMCQKQYTEEGFEMQLGVNYLGAYLLTNLLLDSLKQSAPSRIINITSRSYMRGKINFDDLNCSQTYNRDEAYFQSKLAIILFTRYLAHLLQGSGVTVNAVYPGMAKTNINRHLAMANSMMSKATLGPIYAFLLRSPIQAAQTVLYCGIDAELENVTGKYFSDCKQTDLEDVALDDAAAKRLWYIAQYWTQLDTSTDTT